MKYKAVVFDMDGVIFDSERAVLQGWLQIAERNGIVGLEEVFYRCIGTNITTTKEIFLAHYGEDFPFDQYKQESSAWYHANFDHGRLPMKPGIVELLQYLKAQGYRIGLASSTRIAVVTHQIEAAGLMPYFDHLTGGDMLKRSKPEPDIFLMACEQLGVAPSEAIAIEDSFNGIRSASRAGMFPIMVPDMIAPDEEMRQTAALICPDLFAVKEWLEKQ
ncbi:MAG: HAD family phosphatase [Lachnospiraceae bacterium]|nr:HAD family phosphatase [Lachnospiraceae bacterium]